MYNLRRKIRKTSSKYQLRGIRNISYYKSPPESPDADLKVKVEVNEYHRYKCWITAPKSIKKVGLCENGNYEVETVLDMRQVDDGSLEYLVKWKNWCSDFNSWEPEEHMGGCLKLLEDFEAKHVKENIENESPFVLKKSQEISHSRIKVCKSCCTLEDILRITNQEEQFTSRILDNLQPTGIYGFPKIAGIQGIRLSWEDGLIETVPIKEAMTRWPSKMHLLLQFETPKVETP